jgi:hypothetical protein
MSCAAEIPPEWVAAIKNNHCPGCDGEIMNESSQELLAELAAAMERMPNNPQGLAGWLLSNYKLMKIGTAQPTEKFHSKHNGQTNDFGEIKIANEFLNRSAVAKDIFNTQAKIESLKHSKDPNIVALANKLQQEQEEDFYEDEEDVDMGEEDEDAEYNRRYPSQPMDRPSQLLINSGSNYIDSNVQMNPEVINALATIVSNSTEGASHDPLLERNRQMRIKSQQGFSSGAGGFKK